MDIKSFEDLIEWARELHAHLSRCLSECSTKNKEERARALLTYLADHEAELERITAEFEKQADSRALKTRALRLPERRTQGHQNPPHLR